MKQSPHIFDRFVFELIVPAKDHANAVQNRVSAVASGRLYGVLSDCLREMVDGRDLLVEKLELDVGEVSLESLEEDLMGGIARNLREWALRTGRWRLDSAQSNSIHPQIAQPGTAQSRRNEGWFTQEGKPADREYGGSESFPDNSISIHGSRGLWHGESQASFPGGLNAAVASALQGPGDWRQLSAAMRENRALRGRLAGEVSPELLRGLLRMMLPEHGAWVADFSVALLSLGECGSLAGINPNTFQLTAWEFILEEVTRHHPSSWRLSNFVRNVLRLLATRYSLSESAIVAEIKRRTNQAPQTNLNLVKLIRLLAESNAGAIPSGNSGHSNLRGESSKPNEDFVNTSTWENDSKHRPSQLENLARFLEWGVVPRVMAHRKIGDIENEILELISTSPDEVTRLIRRIIDNPAIRKRLTCQFSEAAYHRVLRLVDPVHASWMNTCARQLRRLHAQKPLVSLGHQAFAQAVAEISFAYLAEHHWQAFDTQSILRYLLQRLAEFQKTSYELLLADAALRRPARPYRGNAVTDTRAAAIDAAILHLLDHDLLGVAEPLHETQQLEGRPASEDLDVDVKTDEPSFDRAAASTHSEETAESFAGATSDNPASQPTFEIAGDQIRHWLLHGTWPSAVSTNNNDDALVAWLEAQSDAAWLQNLRHIGARDHVVRRIVAHLPFAFLLRITSLLAESSADLACGYLCSLLTACRRLTGTVASSWEQKVKRYTLVYLLRVAANHGKPAIFSEELAHYTLQALSLHCQISYQRLLLAVQSESEERPALRDLCHRLQDALGHISIEQSCRASESNAVEDSVAKQEIILHYLRYGSLPEHDSAISMQALRRIGDLLSEDQITVIAQSVVPWIARSDATAQRVTLLFSAPVFSEFVDCVLPSFQFVAELEAALPALATRLLLPEEELLLVERMFLLRYASRHKNDSPKLVNSGNEVMAGLLIGLARHFEVAPPVVLEALTRASVHHSDFVEAVEKLRGRITTGADFNSQTLDDPDFSGNTQRDAYRNVFTPGQHEDASLADPKNNGQSTPGLLNLIRGESEMKGQCTREVKQEGDGANAALDHTRINLEQSVQPSFEPGREEIQSVKVDDDEVSVLELRQSKKTLDIIRDKSTNHREKLDGQSEPSKKTERHEIEAGSYLTNSARQQIESVYELRPYSLSALDGPNESRVLPDPIVELDSRRVCKDDAQNIFASEQHEPRAISTQDRDALEGQLHAFSHLLKTGNLPWWAGSLAQKPSRQWVSELLIGHCDALLRSLKTISENPLAVERLLRYVPEGQLEEIIHAAVPKYDESVILYIRAGAELAGNDGLDQPQRARSEGVHWREALHFVLDKDSPRSSAAEFLCVMSRRVSQQLGIKSARYIDTLLHVAHHLAPAEAGYRVLEDLLLQMKGRARSSSEAEMSNDAADSVASSKYREATIADSQVKSESNNRDGDASITLPMHERAGSRQQSKPGPRDSMLTEDPIFPDDSALIGQVEHLLRYGELPASAEVKSLAQFMDATVEDVASHPAEYRACLRNALRGEVERKRMATMFPARFLSKVWPLLLPKEHALATVCLDLIGSATTYGVSRNQQARVRQICVVELLRAAGRPPSRRWDAAEYLRRTALCLSENLGLNSEAVAQRIRENLSSFTKEMQSKLRPVVDRVERELSVIPISAELYETTRSLTSNLVQPVLSQPNFSQSISPQAGARSAAIQRSNSLPPHISLENISSVNTSKSRGISLNIPPAKNNPMQFRSPLPAGEPFYIRNAGAIILWPFLSRYFRTLDMLGEKDLFRSELERNRGIYLVQYLATGQMEAPEPELLLNKILSGAQPEQPLEPVTRVNEMEERLSLQLLQGVIENWRKLGQASVEGLRQSFLMREGRLSKKEDESWSLVVSTKGYDVLLDNIPWRLSLIRLPWMQAVVHVKWR